MATGATRGQRVPEPRLILADHADWRHLAPNEFGRTGHFEGDSPEATKQNKERPMVSRRALLSLTAGGIAAPHWVTAQKTPRKVALYANVDSDLTHYDIDVENAALIKRDTVTLPAGVQYAWPHASKPYLYVASSSGGPSSLGTDHYLSALRIDSTTGAITPHGNPVQLPTRPINTSTDIPSRNILVAFNNPSAVRVFRINKDFTPGAEVIQRGPLETGIFAHQVRVAPDNKLAILVTRGNEGTPTKPEDPGALKVFHYKDGLLTDEVSIAPNAGKEFGPRHLDFHPSKPWMYVSIETQNKLYTYRRVNGGINPEIVFRSDSLAEPNNIRARQAAGTVHVHPNGRFVYQANRAEATTEFQGKQVFKGGENSIVVYAINPSTGEPTAIQRIETQKIHPRTFYIHPSGRLLVAEHNLPVNVRDGDTVKTIQAGLSVFRVGDDGKLTFARAYDVDVGDRTMFWMGMVAL
jgi:6-phosphogluconolactonase